MENYTPRDHATSNVLAWTATHSANVESSVEEDAGADADEPPEHLSPMIHQSPHFQRAPIRRGSEQHESLLTKALQSHSEDDTYQPGFHRLHRRRRSVTSNTSFASTADLTCTTGITTPARTNSPSPRLPNAGFEPLALAASGDALRNKDPVVHALEKKRCISFACAARPKPDEKLPAQPTARPAREEVKAAEAPKKTCIKFACPQPTRATTAQHREARPLTPVPRAAPSTPRGSSTLGKPRSTSTLRAFRSPTSRRSPGSPVASRTKKWLTAECGDLESECARFHEFASDEPQQDDWIRRDSLSTKPKLTIDDTLKKENAIRKLGKEAEEEAELEEEIDEEQDEEVDEADLIDDEDAEDQDDEDGDEYDDDVGNEEDEGGLDDDVDTEHAWNEEASDGYKTDTEIGFAESDDEDDDLVLWTPHLGYYPTLTASAALVQRQSLGELSDSSTSSHHRSSRSRRKKLAKQRAVPVRPHTPELPDSTDFVCGTLDEDKPLEEAYISCVEARKRDRHQPIPQDIDPSFPTSEPEDEAEELYKKGYGDSEDHVWFHGELEDLHHERDRKGRKKTTAPSPKRCRSPPPKRRPSPAPKARGRSPRKPADLRSPRLRSPAPLRAASKSPILSSAQEENGIAFRSMVFGPGLTQTKSLPKAPGMFPHLLKSRKARAGTVTKQTTSTAHVRGAIDIVKGLEQKRQRRREKFYQKYCSRARKDKAQAKRPPPGQGAERMRELGLFMAGKTAAAGGGVNGRYVLSI